MKSSTRWAAAAASLVIVAGCTNADGTQNRTGTGALAGAGAGALIGNLVGSSRTTATIVGGALGAGLGGAIGNSLDQQAAQLQSVLNGSGAGIVNTGSELVVSLPQAITFDFNSTVLNPGIQDELATIATSLNRYPNTVVEVVGHTDDVGTTEANQLVSDRRAQSVGISLMANGVPESRVRTKGVGYNQPIASNETEAGRAQNRRVDIVITPMG